MYYYCLKKCRVNNYRTLAVYWRVLTSFLELPSLAKTATKMLSAAILAGGRATPNTCQLIDMLQAEPVGYRIQNAFTVTDADTGSNAQTVISCYVDTSSAQVGVVGMCSNSLGIMHL